jgi:hypothetical protein
MSPYSQPVVQCRRARLYPILAIGRRPDSRNCHKPESRAVYCKAAGSATQYPIAIPNYYKKLGLPSLKDEIMTLQNAYYYSQIVLTFIALLAGIIGYLQLLASNQYELLKMLQDEQVRKARRMLWTELCAKKPESKWWEKNDELEQAAALVCGTFDIVALMANYFNYLFFSREWANTICWTYDALKEYLAFRTENNPRSYPHYYKLYQKAKKQKHVRWRYK